MAERLAEARQRSDALFARLTDDAYLTRPIAERHRLIFYLGHLEAFDFNLLVKRAAGRGSVHPAYEALFAFGIDPVEGDLPSDGPEAWPPLSEVRAWVTGLRPLVDDVLATAPAEGWLQDGWAFHVAVEHRLMHVETLSYLLHRLPTELLRGEGPAAPVAGAAPPGEAWVTVPAGTATLGLVRARSPFLGWDNEYERHEVHVPAFRIHRTKVTNGQWRAFMDAGGYDDEALWTEEGWRWIRAQGLRHPGFWAPTAGGFAIRGLAALRPFAPDAPVYVSHAEARAYARWVKARLPTEEEWHRAAYGTPEGHTRTFPWGEEPPRPGVHGNFGLVHEHTTAVGAHPAGASAFGLDEPVGNGWEWTASPFGPFEGFEPLPFYPGYSRNFFDGRHYVLKGASPHTHVTFLRPSFRNWFQPLYPYVTATLRCVEETRA